MGFATCLELMYRKEFDYNIILTARTEEDAKAAYLKLIEKVPDSI